MKRKKWNIIAFFSGGKNREQKKIGLTLLSRISTKRVIFYFYLIFSFWYSQNRGNGYNLELFCRGETEFKCCQVKTTSQTDSALLISFLLSSDAEILLISTD